MSATYYRRRKTKPGLHVIRTDVLLHCLGAFAEKITYPGGGKFGTFTQAEIDAITAWIARPPLNGRQYHRPLQELADMLERPRGSLQVTITRWRQSGKLPPGPDWRAHSISGRFKRP